MGTVCGKDEVLEAVGFQRTVSMRWFPEQPNLEDEIFSKGGRFVTPWFSQLFFFAVFLVFAAGLVLEHLVGLELGHISFPCSSAPCSQPFANAIPVTHLSLATQISKPNIPFSIKRDIHII